MATKVKIKRKQTGTKSQPQQIRDNAKIKLASVYKGGSPVKGFSETEMVKQIMPGVVGADANDPKFYDKVDKWWNELSVNIPTEGKELETAIRTVRKVENFEGKEVEVPVPVNPRDYCIYKFAQVHPQVARNEEEAKTYRNMRFWIEDPDEVKRKKTNERRNETQAFRTLIEMEENEDRVNHMLRVFAGVQPESFDSLDEKVNALTEKMKANPDEFIEVAEDKDLEMQDFVLQCIEYGVLRKVGNQVMYMDEVIGEGTEEVVAYLKNKRHSSTLSTLKAKLKEARS